jgi:hypothetical protein
MTHRDQQDGESPQQIEVFVHSCHHAQRVPPVQ